VAAERPAPQRSAPDEIRCALERDERAVRQRLNRSFVCDFGVRARLNPFPVQRPVNLMNARRAVSGDPESFESLIDCAAALATGEMSCWQSGRRVQNIQLGPRSRRYHLPLPPFELQLADDPRLCCPAAAGEAALVVVHHAAIPGERPTLRYGEDRAERIDAVLQRAILAGVYHQNTCTISSFRLEYHQTIIGCQVLSNYTQRNSSMDHAFKQAVWLQFGAAIDMFSTAVTRCPDALWTAALWQDDDDARYGQFWYVS